MRLAACGWTAYGARKRISEDILVHVHGETPEAARFRAELMGEQERAKILGDYEAMAEKPQFTPWQVAASEALRDGDAVSAIAAHYARGRFHIGYDEEKTLTGLVDDWDRYQRANPDKSSVVLARTRAEVRALSHLMRERRFAALPDGKRARCGPGDGDRQPGDGRRTDGFAARDSTRRQAAYRGHPLGEAAVQRHRGHGGRLHRFTKAEASERSQASLISGAYRGRTKGQRSVTMRSATGTAISVSITAMRSPSHRPRG